MCSRAGRRAVTEDSLFATKKATSKEILGWAMFDFANSSYTTVIVTVVFSVIFPNIIVGDAPQFRRGNLWWAVALSISYALVVVTAPILGAIMDFSASKKKFLFASYLLTVVATMALYFVTPGAIGLGILLVVISNYGFAAGESFCGAFLPDLGEPHELGRVSGFAWGLGYFGGIASTALIITLLGPQTVENFSAQRFVGPLCGLFFLVAAIPTFVLVKERGTASTVPRGSSYVRVGFQRLEDTWRVARTFRDLMSFLASLFFASAGLYIVITFAFIYGAQVIHWGEGTKVMMFVLTNIAAAAGAVIFGVIQDRIGDKLTYNITLLIWIVGVSLIYGTPRLTGAINSALGTRFLAEHVFLGVGCLCGLALGATQSAGRAIVGVFSPQSKSGEFFGLWGLAGKLAAIAGLLSVGVLQYRVGLQKAILLTSAFFLVAFLLTFFVNEGRGKQAARDFRGVTP